MPGSETAISLKEIRAKTRWWLGYVVAVVGPAVAGLLRWAILSFIGGLPLYLTFYPAVFAAAVIGGTWPGVLATLLSALIADIFFIEPVGTLSRGVTAHTVSALLFISINLAISYLGGRFRRNAAALRDSDARFRLAHQVTRIGTFEWNVETGVNTWSTQLEGMYGLKPGQFGRTLAAWEALVHPDDRPNAVAAVQRALQTFETEEAEWRVVWPDRSVHWLVGRFHAIPDGAGKPARLVGANVEITERKQAEHVLARQARLIDLAPAATLVRTLDGTITFWSDGATRLYGWTSQEAIGRRTSELLHTEYPVPLESIIASLRGGGTWVGELKHVTKDGRILIVESYWLAELNAKGEVEELLESNTDITERKRLQGHLEDAVKQRTAKLHEAMSDLEQMSYSMIHDMRAPLRAMQSFSSLIQDECAEACGEPAMDYLSRIRESAIRLDRLLTDALNYSRVSRENVPLGPVDLGQLLRGLLQTYPHLQPPTDITFDFNELVVLGNESLLTQCFGNLLTNATKFVPAGTRAHVRVWAEARPVTEEQEQRKQQTEQPASSLVRVWVADNGIGIPKDAHEKIFHMFQRLHSEAEYPGTGIGLAIVRKAVERMGGRVGLESAPGQGSRFWVELPLLSKSPAEAELQRAA